jgi:hypothetical protein
MNRFSVRVVYRSYLNPDAYSPVVYVSLIYTRLYREGCVSLFVLCLLPFPSTNFYQTRG